MSGIWGVHGSHQLRRAELVKDLAAKEAARRRLGTPTEVGDVTLLDEDKLHAVLHDEMSKNDAAWAEVRQAAPAATTPTHTLTPLAKQKLELAMLDAEIDSITHDLETANAVHSSDILSLLTRATMADAVEQFQVLNAKLRKEVQVERERLHTELGVLDDIEQVSKGLTMRMRVLNDRVEKRGEETVEDRLARQVQTSREAIRASMRSLVDAIDRLFEDEGEHVVLYRAQMKHLMDRLLNLAWDNPMWPYVQTKGHYAPVVSDFAIQACVALPHPSDAKSMRLIPFHEALQL